MAEERLQPISLHQEMQRSYLEYAMSVIVGRALPDARDGLKPVQRRILFAMHELGLTPERPYKKCARVVGDVLGKYHPHGDQAVYDALVRLVQSFASRYPVLDGHGNFGSVDDDPPAAMRYTETRLASIANKSLLEEIGSETVDFNSNFDGSQQEPSVLPAQLPFLLLNGCSGIAVGMATSIPPHNLNEIIDGLIALIRNPELSVEKLLKLIPGPDFPTGGEILLGSGIKETYTKGRGSIPMRGVAHIEEINPGKGKHKRSAVIITELPYQLSKAGWIEKLADLVNDSKIGGIADIRDESDREGMRIVVELKRDANPEMIVKELHQRTSLQSNFGAILLALVNGQPKQLSIKDLLKTFLEFRELTVIKRTRYSVNKVTERLTIVLGLIIALKELKKVIELIQNARDAGEAKVKLIKELKISNLQADAVLAMPLRRLTSLEQNNLYLESEELKAKKLELEVLLNDRDQLLHSITKELKSLKKQFGNPRRTKLIEGGDQLLAERTASQRPNAELQRKQALEALPSDGRLLIQNDNQVKIISPQTLGRLHFYESCPLGEEPAPAKIILSVQSKPKLLAITNAGRVALLKWEFAGQQPGLMGRFLPGGIEKEKVNSLIALPKDKNLSLGLLSTDGRFKRLSLEEVVDLSGRAATILKLKDGVSLKSTILCYPDDDIIIASDVGRVLKIKVNEESMPIMGKLAQGPMTMKLLPEESVVGAISSRVNSNNSFILATKNGTLSKISINSIRECKRGSFGDIAISLKDSKNIKNRIVDICNGDGLIGIVSSQGRHGRIIGSDIIETTPEVQSSTTIQLKDNESLNKLVPLISEKENII